MATLSKNNLQKARFIAVGGANTVIDFGLLFVLKGLGLPALSANLVSTSAAFCFSFFANKKFTFKTTNTNLKRELTLFIIATLTGLWGIQSLVIMIISPIVAGFGLSDGMTLLAAKICATIASLTWNYIMYSRVVFKQSA